MTRGGADALAARWQDALLAAQLFAIDPSGLGGVAVTASPGPVRDRWTERLTAMLADDAPIRRLPVGIQDDRLLGGIDLVETLRAGRPVIGRGLLAEADGGIVVIPMAERLSIGVAARLVAVLDRRVVDIERDGLSQAVPTRIGIVAYDEASTPEEGLPDALAGRLAFRIDLRDLSYRRLDDMFIDHAALAPARARLPEGTPAAEEIVEAIAATAIAFGIEGVIPAILALRAAHAAAALAGRRDLVIEDAVLAARLVLAPRARTLPTSETADEPDDGDAPDQTEEPQPPDPRSAEEEPARAESDPPDPEPDSPSPSPPTLEDILLEAVRSALPPNLLALLKEGARRQPGGTRGGAAGAAQPDAIRGRPIGVKPGSLRGGARLALVETLRAAAPWQRLRRPDRPPTGSAPRIEVRGSDIRVKRYIKRREATIVFCVDASGSAAFHRLAETKGAVELLLADAYVARTYAALVAFRGKGADLLLPPTRSLSRAKVLLADLPGGGGTPLASGIDLAMQVAVSERGKGRDPLIVLMTDGRANIGRNGAPARPGATREALAAARAGAIAQIKSVCIDTAPRPRGEAAELAAAMAARYVALPYLGAEAVADVVRAVSPATRRDGGGAR